MTTADVLGLLAMAIGFVVLAAFVFWSQYRLWKVLNDPDHPEHEMAKEAVIEQHREAERDRFRFP